MEHLKLLNSTAHPYCPDDKIEKNVMDGARSAYGGEESRIHGFGGGNLREKDHLGEPGVDGSSGSGM